MDEKHDLPAEKWLADVSVLSTNPHNFPRLYMNLGIPEPTGCDRSSVDPDIR